MEVNVTLFLQITQFAIAYLFLYRFLFVPACKILDEEELVEKQLHKKIEKEQEVKDVLLQNYHEKSSHFKSALIESIPAQATESVHKKSMFGSTLYSVEENQLSDQDRKKTESFLVDHLSQVIKK
jgi:F0F1-type ATP synthase membrane subunit b/b'